MWTKETYKDFREELFSQAEEGYRKFNEKLLCSARKELETMSANYPIDCALAERYLAAKRNIFDALYSFMNEKQREAMRAFADSCGEGNYSKRAGFFKRIFDKK